MVSLLFPFGSNVISLLHVGPPLLRQARLQYLNILVKYTDGDLRQALTDILSDEFSLTSDQESLQKLSAVIGHANKGKKQAQELGLTTQASSNKTPAVLANALMLLQSKGDDIRIEVEFQ